MRASRALAIIALFSAACGRDVHPPSGGSAASSATGATGGTGGTSAAGGGGSGGSPGVAECGPGVARLAYVDADGDGAGAPETAACLTETELPEGYSGFGNDCDDHDATIGPGIADRPGDGIDRDCDGRDGVVDCAAAPSVCPCATFANHAIEVDDACERFDLALIALDACGSGCNGTERFVLLANLGTDAVSAPVTLGWSSGPVVTWVDGLAAGEISAPIWLPRPPRADDLLTAAALEPGDCDPTNNTRAAPIEDSALCAK
jgi:hypothetical protein